MGSKVIIMIFFSWPWIIIIIIDHLLKAGCQLSNGGWLCDKIMRTCNYGLPIHISKFVRHWQLLWQWQWQWRYSYSYSSFIICAISCLSLGGPKGRLGGSFVSTPWSPIAVFWTHANTKSFVPTPRSQYSLFLCRQIVLHFCTDEYTNTSLFYQQPDLNTASLYAGIRHAYRN